MSLAISFNGKIFEVKDVPVHSAPSVMTDKDGKKDIYLDPDSCRRVSKLVVGEKAETKWVFEDGSAFDGKAVKSFKGKPIAEFSKTTVLEGLREDDLVEVLLRVCENEHTYYLVNASFKLALKALGSGRCLLFRPFKIRGLVAYTAVIYYDAKLDRVMMRLCRGELNAQSMSEAEKVKEAEVKGEAISDSEIAC